MDMPALAAGWLLVPVVPICFWVAWSDLSRMKIPNKAVFALILAFALIGPFVLPFGDWAWRWSHLAVMLVAGIGFNAAGIMGAGDAKFIAGAAPYVALGDLGPVMFLLAMTFFAGYLSHRLVMKSPLRTLAPDWASWSAGNRFPMGFPLAVALLLYLGLAVLRG